MNRGAVWEERNRALSDEAIAALDPAGIHVLTFSMPHSHIAGVSFKDFDSYTYETNAIPTKEQK